jgi:hypothetical protein
MHDTRPATDVFVSLTQVLLLLLRIGLTTVPYTATAVQNTVPYGCGPYRNRTRTRKTQALDGTVTVINGRITAPYGSTSIISI